MKRLVSALDFSAGPLHQTDRLPWGEGEKMPEIFVCAARAARKTQYFFSKCLPLQSTILRPKKCQKNYTCKFWTLKRACTLIWQSSVSGGHREHLSSARDQSGPFRVLERIKGCLFGLCHANFCPIRGPDCCLSRIFRCPQWVVAINPVKVQCHTFKSSFASTHAGTVHSVNSLSYKCGL